MRRGNNWSGPYNIMGGWNFPLRWHMICRTSSKFWNLWSKWGSFPGTVPTVSLEFYRYQPVPHHSTHPISDISHAPPVRAFDSHVQVAGVRCSSDSSPNIQLQKTTAPTSSKNHPISGWFWNWNHINSPTYRNFEDINSPTYRNFEDINSTNLSKFWGLPNPNHHHGLSTTLGLPGLPTLERKDQPTVPAHQEEPSAHVGQLLINCWLYICAICNICMCIVKLPYVY